MGESGGSARSPSAEEMIAMQRELAETEGIYAEVSSVISLCVAKKLVDCLQRHVVMPVEPAKGKRPLRRRAH